MRIKIEPIKNIEQLLSRSVKSFSGSIINSGDFTDNIINNESSLFASSVLSWPSGMVLGTHAIAFGLHLIILGQSPPSEVDVYGDLVRSLRGKSVIDFSLQNPILGGLSNNFAGSGTMASCNLPFISCSVEDYSDNSCIGTKKEKPGNRSTLKRPS